MPISDIPIFSMLRSRMQWHQERQRVLAQNVANSDTRDYQPRDLNPHASLVKYDSTTRLVEWVRYEYPIFAVQQKIHDAHLPEYLAARLEAGR